VEASPPGRDAEHTRAQRAAFRVEAEGTLDRGDAFRQAEKVDDVATGRACYAFRDVVA
jgi:hypothetical protein